MHITTSYVGKLLTILKKTTMITKNISIYIAQS